MVSIDRQSVGVLVCLLAGVLGGAQGFSTGAGPTACGNMVPKHFALRPNWPPADMPYEFILSQNEYRPGDTIRVTIRGLGEQTFKGFLVQARMDDRKNDRWYGTWRYDDITNRLQCQWTDESGEVHNAITQTAPGKSQARVLTDMTLWWTAPKQSVGNIVFNITIVHSYWTVWTGYSTPVVQALDAPGPVEPANTPAPPGPVEPTSTPAPPGPVEPTSTPAPPGEEGQGREEERRPTQRPVEDEPVEPGPTGQDSRRFVDPCPWQPVEPVFAPLNAKDCGVEHSCFRWPPGCVDPICEVFLTWRDDGDRVAFEVSARTDGWVGVGLSHDKFMGDDSVTTCTYRPYQPENSQDSAGPGQVSLCNRYNMPTTRTNEIVSNAGLTNTGGFLMREGRARSVLRCRFSRDKWALEGREPRIFDLFNAYYIMVAIGHANTAGDISQHSTIPKVTPIKVKLDMTPIDIQDKTGI